MITVNKHGEGARTCLWRVFVCLAFQGVLKVSNDWICHLSGQDLWKAQHSGLKALQVAFREPSNNQTSEFIISLDKTFGKLSTVDLKLCKLFLESLATEGVQTFQSPFSKGPNPRT